jgi:RimJ/RimL family protein N-acetyltransferase
MIRVDSVIKDPGSLNPSELRQFCEFVRRGDEVQSQGLEDRVKQAKALVLLQVNSELVGIAAIKQPLKTYRDGVFKKAGVPEAAEAFQLELGWVYVPPQHRRQGYSRVLSVAAMSQADRKPTFATTRLDNVAMHRTLENLGFRRLGDSWRSDRGKKPRLVLYTKM